MSACKLVKILKGYYIDANKITEVYVNYNEHIVIIKSDTTKPMILSDIDTENIGIYKVLENLIDRINEARIS